jgi:tetratricopeptide (TPR) repeat protein
MESSPAVCGLGSSNNLEDAKALRIFDPLRLQGSRHPMREGQMSPFRCHLWIASLLIPWLLIPIGCRPKQVVVPAPKVNAEANAYVAEADAHSRDFHLYGWRKAEALYQKAYALTGSDAVKRKLLLTRFLIFIRQIDEDIPYSGSDEIIRELCAGDGRQQTLGSIAKWYRDGKNARQIKLDSPMFKGEDPNLDSYLNLLLFDAIPRRDAFTVSDMPSPLFLYLNPGKLLAMDTVEIEKNYPQFAEAYDHIAESLFQKKKYRAARAYFHKAIELIPDYTHAYIGLGNIYFYALEDYERALRYYETALESDHSSAGALLGKGLSLHQLGRHQDSNVVADQLLTAPISRNQWIGDVPDVRYYRGEGNYLKAYNYHLMRDPAQAREFVNAAKESLADSEDINYLSGLLFYLAKDLESARKDFQRVIQRGNYNCNAQLHLGLIYRQLKDSAESSIPKDESDKKADTFLLGAAACMESTVLSLRTELSLLESTDLEPQERFVLRGRMQKRLSDEHLASCSTIEMIMRKLSEDGIGEKSVYLTLLKEILARLRGLSLQPGIDAPGTTGSAP